MVRDVRLWVRFGGTGRYDGDVPAEALAHEPAPQPKEPPRWRCAEHGLVEEPVFVGNVPYCYWLTCDLQLEDLRPAAKPKPLRRRRRAGPVPQARQEPAPELEVDEVDQISAESSVSGPSPEPMTAEETMPKNDVDGAKYPRGALQEELLATLARAPGRTMTYEDLAGALWPGVDRSVWSARLSSAMQRARKKGQLRLENGAAILLITAQMPTEGLAAPSIVRARQAVKRDGSTPPAVAAPRTGGRAGVLVDPLRAALQGRIEHLQALLKSLDDVEHALNEAAA